MKIGLVLESFDPQRGGLEQWTWQFGKRLTGLGHEVHVIACEFAVVDPSVPLIFHPVQPSPSPLRRAAAMEQTLRSLQLDVIHDMGCGWHADVFHAHGGSTLALWDHNLRRIPRWRQFRLWRERRYVEQEAIERRQHSRDKAVVVAVSAMVKNHFHTLHRLPLERITLIYNGVDTEWFSPQHRDEFRDPMRRELRISEGETIFLLVAHNLRLKNADSAIRGLARLISQGLSAHLLIVGGKRPLPFIRLVKKFGLSQNVTFVEPLLDVRPYYAAADVYLHPTWYDPCSLVALEALACGLPVITTRYNGVSEMMTEGKNGFILSDPADVSTLATKMKELLDRDLRSRMGTAARELSLEHTLQRQTEEFLALYESVAAV